MSDNVEVSRAELDTLRRGYALLDRLWTDPADGLTVKKIAKKVEPTLKVPDLDLVTQVSTAHDEKFAALEKQNTELQERLEKFQTELRERDEDTKLSGKFEKVRKDFGLTNEGLDQVVSLMRERQIADPEAAAALWSRNQPPAPKPVTSPNYLPASLDIMNQFGPEEEMKQWLADPLKKFDNEVAKILSETPM